MALTLLRHAPLPKVHQNCYNGWHDIAIDKTLLPHAKLSPLKKMDFDLIFSSDLKRCRETLDILEKSYTTDTRLREVKFKPHIEGKSFEEIERLESFDPSYLDSEERWHTYICEESPTAFKARLRDFLDTLPKNRAILLCTHAGSIKVILELLGHKAERLDYLEVRTYEL